MPTTAFAAEARRAKADHAASLGIDEALISDLVETFYARVREDSLLGPIFAKHIADWPSHLAKMKNFWASIAIESGRFHGNPMLKHIAIGSLESRHFDHWLALFFATLEDVVSQERARAFFRQRAERIADSLLTGIELDRDGLKSPRTRTRKKHASC